MIIIWWLRSPFCGRRLQQLYPQKRTKRLPVKLTLDPSVRAQAEMLPEVIDRGLSALVERLLREEIARRTTAEEDLAGR